MVVGGQHPFLEVNAQKTRVFNVSTAVGAKGGSFSSYVQVDDDQSFLLDGLDTVAGQTTGTDGVICNATTCNPAVSYTHLDVYKRQVMGRLNFRFNLLLGS